MSSHPVPAHILPLAGLNLHYTVFGEGSPAVLVHGYAHTGIMWERPLETYLKRAYRCYVIDLPGHGQSSKPPLEWFTIPNYTAVIGRFCQALNLEQILLIGYSMGGMIGLNLALEQPHLISTLISINAPVHGEFLAKFDWIERLVWFIRQPVAEKLFRLYTRYHLLHLPVEVRRYASPKMVFSPSCFRIQREMGQSSLVTLYGNYRAIRAMDLRPRLAGLTVPTLAITTDRDKVVPPDHTWFLAETVPQARLALIPNCGHLPLDEQPQAFDQVICEYLDLA